MPRPITELPTRLACRGLGRFTGLRLLGRLPSYPKVGVQSCKVYVKPEEDAAYYVINKVSGKLEL